MEGKNRTSLRAALLKLLKHFRDLMNFNKWTGNTFFCLDLSSLIVYNKLHNLPSQLILNTVVLCAHV